jgi:hypothetical protein
MDSYPSHYGLSVLGEVPVLSEEQFDAWVASMGQELDEVYETFEEDSEGDLKYITDEQPDNDIIYDWVYEIDLDNRTLSPYFASTTFREMIYFSRPSRSTILDTVHTTSHCLKNTVTIGVLPLLRPMQVSSKCICPATMSRPIQAPLSITSSVYLKDCQHPNGHERD